MASPTKKRGRGRPKIGFANKKLRANLKNRHDSNREDPIGTPVQTSTPASTLPSRGRGRPRKDGSPAAKKPRISNIVLGNRVEEVDKIDKRGRPGRNSPPEIDLTGVQLSSDDNNVESASQPSESALEGSARVRGRPPKKQSPLKQKPKTSDITHDVQVESTDKKGSSSLNSSPKIDPSLLIPPGAAQHSAIPNLKIDFAEQNGRWKIVISGTGPILHPDVTSTTCKHCNTHFSSLQLTSNKNL
ncbi:unnamed protein product [Bursaphelenchus xylophilus]|uniref:(pine wood nematode) hypothetical protein n=1 Tax=Bursaphelenchus xylophilus TaxID=6326 RepID=A0A1I7RWQ6_BURXY|nr:unnamed protein product [Bursaphelenchus xylophilus]CAG9128578.1 unnamed protein product [Bursaphelenchus xylophilus]